jgi:hypothetical protein
MKANLKTEFNKACAKKLIAIIRALPYEQERRLLGDIANSLGYGGQEFVAEAFGRSIEFVSKGQKEARTGLAEVPQTSSRGRLSIIEKFPGLVDAIRALLAPYSSADSRLRNEFYYTPVALGEIKEGLRKAGFDVLPSDAALYELLNDLGYVLKPVLKFLPKMCIPETDTIFETVWEMQDLAEADPETAWVSIDCKDKIAIGKFSRGGKNRTGEAALDHDFSPYTLRTPFGILDVKSGKTSVWMTDGPATADLMSDCIEEWWVANGAGRKTLLMNLDNGPSNSSYCGEFVKRMAEMSSKYNIYIVLSYYPPYLSKYNLIERLWASIEKHISGCILDSIDKEPSIMSLLPSSTVLILTSKCLKRPMKRGSSQHKVLEKPMKKHWIEKKA